MVCVGAVVTAGAVVTVGAVVWVGAVVTVVAIVPVDAVDVFSVVAWVDWLEGSVLMVGLLLQATKHSNMLNTTSKA